MLIQRYEKQSGKTICSGLCLCTANRFWIHSIWKKPVLSEYRKVAQQKKLICAFSSLLLYHSLSINTPSQFQVICDWAVTTPQSSSWMVWPAANQHFHSSIWGKCRATKSKKGFRNTAHIYTNINGATWSSESNVFPYKNAHGKNWQVLQETALVTLK